MVNKALGIRCNCGFTCYIRMCFVGSWHISIINMWFFHMLWENGRAISWSYIFHSDMLSYLISNGIFRTGLQLTILFVVKYELPNEKSLSFVLFIDENTYKEYVYTSWHGSVCVNCSWTFCLSLSWHSLSCHKLNALFVFLLQLEDGSKREGNLILFPPSDRQTQEFHMNTMVQDIAASLLMEFEKWVLQAESAGTILKTPLDSQASLSSEEVYVLGVLRIWICIYVFLHIYSSFNAS